MRIVRKLKLLVLILLSLSATACSWISLDTGYSYDAGIEAQLITQEEDLYPEVDLLALNQEIRDYLDTNVPANVRTWERVSRLQELLFSEEFLNIQYEDSANFTAIEVFNQQRANCLSLVNLYVAMARYLGIDANYHTVQIKPMWDRRGELLVVSEHINATGRVNQSSRYIVDFTPEVSLQQLTARVVTDQHARALYFNNLGVERLIEGDTEGSLPYFRNALWLEPELAIAWNNMGTALNRLQEFEFAEYSYKRSFSLDNSSSTAINNLARFYNARGEFARAERYLLAIERFNNKNPYYHYLKGNQAYLDGDFEQARSHYLDAIRRKEVEPEFYYALGLTLRELGKTSEAEQMIQLARAVLELGDQTYRSSREKVRLIQDDTIFTPTSSGFSILLDR